MILDFDTTLCNGFSVNIEAEFEGKDFLGFNLFTRAGKPLYWLKERLSAVDKARIEEQAHAAFWEL